LATAKQSKFGTSIYIPEPRASSESSIPQKRRRGTTKNDTRPHASGGHCPPVGELSQSAPMRRQDPHWSPVQAGCRGGDVQGAECTAGQKDQAGLRPFATAGHTR